MSNESYLNIKIGKGCMFSNGILFRETDGHIIYDKYSKKLLNRSKPIIIGDHVWIVSSITVLTILLLVQELLPQKYFPKKNIIIAGNPAIIIKRDIT